MRSGSEVYPTQYLLADLRYNMCVSVKFNLSLGFNVFTSKVKLRPVYADCARDLVVMRPWRAVFTELKKLDFPAPCGPCRRILRVSTSVFLRFEVGHFFS